MCGRCYRYVAFPSHTNMSQSSDALKTAKLPSFLSFKHKSVINFMYLGSVYLCSGRCYIRATDSHGLVVTVADSLYSSSFNVI